ncbi:MAG: YidC/Oxa1 family membrane protein insertase [Acidimicrobiales bacterium]
MFDFLAGLLAFFYQLWPSYGGAIILFTLAVMLVLSPLSIKSTRSMLAMQRLSPELKKLQQKHKGDREALNREMMAFYQEHNVNPFSSCLPLLLQMPVFIVLYRVLLGLTRRSVAGDPTSNFDPSYLEGKDTPLAVALRAANEMRSFGMDLSQSALSELQRGLLVAVPFIVLIGLVVLTAVVQQRQVTGRNPAAANPQQKIMARVFPLIMVAISISIPAGVVLYFLVSNGVRIGQQALVTRLERDGGPGQREGGRASGPSRAGDAPPEGRGGGGRADRGHPKAEGDGRDGGRAAQRGTPGSNGGASGPSARGAGNNRPVKGTGRTGSSRPASRRRNRKKRK